MYIKILLTGDISKILQKSISCDRPVNNSAIFVHFKIIIQLLPQHNLFQRKKLKILVVANNLSPAHNMPLRYKKVHFKTHRYADTFLQTNFFNQNSNIKFLVFLDETHSFSILLRFLKDTVLTIIATPGRQHATPKKLYERSCCDMQIITFSMHSCKAGDSSGTYSMHRTDFSAGFSYGNCI